MAYFEKHLIFIILLDIIPYAITMKENMKIKFLTLFTLVLLLASACKSETKKQQETIATDKTFRLEYLCV